MSLSDAHERLEGLSLLPALPPQVLEAVDRFLGDHGVLGAEADEIQVHVVPEGQGDLKVLQRMGFIGSSLVILGLDLSPISTN